MIDNGSTDGTREYIKKEKRISKYIFADKNLFMTDAYKKAFEEVKSELFITTTDDVLPPKGWLTKMIRLTYDNPEYASITMGCGNKSFIKYLIRKYGKITFKRRNKME